MNLCGIIYITFRIIESIRSILGHGGHMTGAGAEAKVVNSGRVSGEVKRLCHLFELSGFAEHHFPHIHVRCKAFVKMILVISFYLIFRRRISLINMYLKAKCSSLPEAATNRPQGDIRAR